jgi:hypothetical protein
MAVRVHDDTATASLSDPEPLFSHESSGHLVVAPGGARFVGLRKVEHALPKPFTLVLDWPLLL